MKKIAYIFLFLLHFSAYSQKNEDVIASGNSKLHYKTFGSGKPILIINGGPGMNCEGFGYLAEEISKFGFQTIIYDQRGTGKSVVEKINDETISMDLMVDDMENLRKHLKIEKWTILGHSFGGMLAAYYATKHPQNIDKMIFSSSGGVNMNFTSYGQQRLNANLTKTQKDSMNYYQSKMDKGDNSLETKKQRAKYLANAYVYDKKNAPIIAERLIHVNFDVNGIVFQSLIKNNFDCSEKFGNFHNSVLILQGENDIISIDTAKEIEKAFPNSQLIALPNCGHYGWLDAKEMYFNALKQFLKTKTNTTKN
ncbi:alpha/beta hydrolase fold protein [Flavobacterium limnosediminis JC2902]|uniref:Alpha/beta hydrolase fold protein n=1 Tax=Flavobacterium limnosediminis JC2902 TaxID=1341181 RepID=V6SLX7_9FLAO|nr:alpha/beta fold hydrolase [Flavobacterium limnosediminis]ESU27232.1 alpha/beta hydrolase fold protein [Flavobacterium limnosediminis JC2902]